MILKGVTVYENLLNVLAPLKDTLQLLRTENELANANYYITAKGKLTQHIPPVIRRC